MEEGEISEMATEVALVEEDADAELAPLSGPVARRKARFLSPRAEADTSDAPRRPLLWDVLPQRLAPWWPPRVVFRGWRLPQYGWAGWVRRLRSVYGKVWRRTGICGAIAASTCTVLYDVPVFLGLLECWSSETNTFVFPWPRPAEATVTLEDIMLLGGFSAVGEPVRAAAAWGPEEEELLAWLTAEHKNAERRSSSGRVSHRDWAGRFRGLAGSEPDELEHAAFLSLWLSRYVFPAPPHGSVGRHVFPLTARLARGARVALAPAVLASIYRDLHIAVRSGDSAAPLEAWAPFQLLQLWAWERFESLRPPDPPRPLSGGKPRAMRWDKLGPQRRSVTSVRRVLESPGEFRWRPYAATVSDWSCPSFYSDDGDRWVTVGPGGDDDEMRSYARCLRACELVGLDSVEHYAPQRVAMQFGLDQDLPGSVPHVHGACGLAWATYDAGDERVRFFVPPRSYEPGATKRFLDWQTQCARDRRHEARRMAEKQTRREEEKRRRQPSSKSTSLMPDREFRTQKAAHGRSPSPVREESSKLYMRGGDGSRSVKTTKRRKAGEVLGPELARVTEDYALQTDDQQSSCGPVMMAKVPQKTASTPSRISFVQLESDDEELQRTKSGEASASVLNKEKEGLVLNTNGPESSFGSVVAEEPEVGMPPCGITIIEIESDDEELRRQKDLEFDREIDQLKYEIASLQALITRLESSSQVESSDIANQS